jgi:VIT1/CCC1 family predicted Fe2+/Mn2+ transporter
MKNAAYWKRIIYRPGPVLDPISRLSEIIFGLIMVLTFTGSISAASAGRSEIGVILWAALGCNVAWGIVDAFMYIMSLMMERGDAANSLRTAQNAGSEEAVEQIKEYLPPAIVEVLTKEQLESIRLGLRNLPEPPERIPVLWRDIRAAVLIFFLVALSTLPCSIPFLLIKDPAIAMRVSNGVAILLLFITGFRLAKYTGYNKLLFGIIVAVLGFVLVGMTIALGG